VKIFRGKADRGATAVVVALTLVVLVGFTAVAIDGGRAYGERRSTQNASDQAALAAAWAACTQQGDSAAVAAGLASASTNGFSTGVTVQRMSGSTASYEATVTAVQENTFGRVIGANQLTIESRAVADCIRNIWGGGYALFASAPPQCASPVELDFTGGGVEVYGQVHSNGDLRIVGNNADPSTIHGLTTYVGTNNSNNVNFAGGESRVPTQPDPFNVNINDYRPGTKLSDFQDGVNYFSYTGVVMAGQLEDGVRAIRAGSRTRILQSGVYYTNGEFRNLSLEMAPGVTATFVAEGRISISGYSNNSYYIGDPNKVVMFSNYQEPEGCGNIRAIQFSASSGTWTGLIYAPNGEVVMSMAEGTGFDGAIYGYFIDLSGSGYSITYRDLTEGGPTFEVALQE
jgi:hypothetical protein